MRHVTATLFWCSRPLVGAGLGFLAGFAVVTFALLTVGGLDPARSLGVSDDLVNYLPFLAGLFSAGVAVAVLTAHTRPAFVLTVGLPVLSGSAAYLAVVLAFDITTGSGAVAAWSAAAAVVVATGLVPILVSRG